MLIDLLRTPSGDLETGDALIKRKEVTKAVAQISQIADMSHSAKGSVRVINQLLGESLSRSRSVNNVSRAETEHHFCS